MSARANAHFSLQQTGTHVWFLHWRPMKESWCVHLKLRHPQRHPSQSSKGRRWAPSHLLSGSNNNLANWRRWFSQKSEPIPNAEIIWNPFLQGLHRCILKSIGKQASFKNFINSAPKYSPPELSQVFHDMGRRGRHQHFSPASWATTLWPYASWWHLSPKPGSYDQLCS